MANTGDLAKFLPAVIFIVACFIGFATGTSWGTIGIMVPLVCAVFDWTTQVDLLSIGLAASCAGGVCGDHLSPISDTTIMASAGAHCYHLNHVSTQIPYGVTVAAVSFCQLHHRRSGAERGDLHDHRHRADDRHPVRHQGCRRQEARCCDR